MFENQSPPKSWTTFLFATTLLISLGRELTLYRIPLTKHYANSWTGGRHGEHPDHHRKPCIASWINLSQLGALSRSVEIIAIVAALGLVHISRWCVNSRYFIYVFACLILHTSNLSITKAPCWIYPNPFFRNGFLTLGASSLAVAAAARRGKRASRKAQPASLEDKRLANGEETSQKHSEASYMRGCGEPFFGWAHWYNYQRHLPILYDCTPTWCDHSYSWFGPHFAQTPWHMHGTLQTAGIDYIGHYLNETQVPCAVASWCSSGHLPQDARVCAPGRRVRAGIGGFVETWLGGNAGT